MKGKTFETKKVYIILSLITLISATLALLISNGKLFQVLFFIDPDDTGMDFFNSLIEVHTGKPYSQFHVLYPPFANLFFYALQLFVPDSFKENWPTSHEEAKLTVGTHTDVRLMQSTMVLFLLFLIITLFMIAVMIHSQTKSYLLTFCLVFSAGTLQAIERGNVILLAFLLTLYFVRHYQDKNRFTSELALFALACAFGFKLYPCIFGILLLKDRKWAAAGRTILYAILVIILPTFLFEGPGCLTSWLRSISSFGGVTPAETISNASGNSFPLRIITITLLGAFLLVLCFVRRNRKPILQIQTSQFLFLTTYFALILTNGTDNYNLLFFVIPFLSFLQEEKALNRYNIIEFIVYLVCLLPVGINNISPLFFALYMISVVCNQFSSRNIGHHETSNR